MSVLNEFILAFLAVVVVVTFRLWYECDQRKYRYRVALRKRTHRAAARKAKAERFAKYGPPGLLEQAICSVFDACVDHAFPSLNRKK
jgi:hypothetical protein